MFFYVNCIVLHAAGNFVFDTVSFCTNAMIVLSTLLLMCGVASLTVSLILIRNVCMMGIYV